MTLLHDAIKRLRPEIDEENVDPESWLLFHQRVGFKQARDSAAELAQEADQQHEALRNALAQMIELAELSQGLDMADCQAIERARTTLKETSR